MALYLDAAGFKWQEKEIVFDNGAMVRSGLKYGPKGEARDAKRPQQIFTR